MAINGTEFFESKQRQFGQQGSESRFPNDYMVALRLALVSLAEGLDEDDFTCPTDTETDIDVDAIYEPALSAWVDSHILTLGNFRLGDKTPEEMIAVAERFTAKARTRRDRVTREAATDEDEVGLIEE